jgi:hypothetical protein
MSFQSKRFISIDFSVKVTYKFQSHLSITIYYANVLICLVVPIIALLIDRE